MNYVLNESLSSDEFSEEETKEMKELIKNAINEYNKMQVKKHLLNRVSAIDKVDTMEKMIKNKSYDKKQYE